MSDFAASRFWHLIYEVADQQAMANVAAMAARARAGIVYITDATMPNPWERLSAYWREERALLARSGRVR